MQIGQMVGFNLFKRLPGDSVLAVCHCLALEKRKMIRQIETEKREYLEETTREEYERLRDEFSKLSTLFAPLGLFRLGQMIQCKRKGQISKYNMVLGLVIPLYSSVIAGREAQLHSYYSDELHPGFYVSLGYELGKLATAGLVFWMYEIINKGFK